MLTVRRKTQLLPFPSSKYLSFEDTILEANSYGLPFDILMNFTFGELSYYIRYHREQKRRAYQEKSILAYYQAALTAKIMFGDKVGEVFEEFPYWTEDEILDIRAEQVVSYFNNIPFDD